LPIITDDLHSGSTESRWPVMILARNSRSGKDEVVDYWVFDFAA
jgi:hypothetical protein